MKSFLDFGRTGRADVSLDYLQLLKLASEMKDEVIYGLWARFAPCVATLPQWSVLPWSEAVLEMRFASLLPWSEALLRMSFGPEAASLPLSFFLTKPQFGIEVCLPLLKPFHWGKSQTSTSALDLFGLFRFLLHDWFSNEYVIVVVESSVCPEKLRSPLL